MSFLLPVAASAGVGLLGSLFSGSKPQVNYTPPGFNAGGLSATFGGNGYNVTPSADRSGTVSGLSNTFTQEGNQFGNLASTVQPGFSALRKAQLDQLNNSRTAALGNLQQNLARRRVLGSSFGQDAITRANLDYNQQAANIQAQTYLQELQSSQQLIQQQYTAASQSFQTNLNEMNLEAGVAADLTGKASQTLSQVAAYQAKLDAESAAGAGKFFGNIGSQLGSALGSFFSGGGSSAAGAGLSAAAALL